MFFELNDENGSYESNVGLLFDRLPSALATFLTPMGTEWDASLDRDLLEPAPIPSPEDLRLEARGAAGGFGSELPALPEEAVGSNNWAVSGARSAHGGALLANDMHLAHSVPNIWFRAELRWPSHHLIGVTLPGVPFLVAGSNTKVAWGFTNTNGDWVDLVEIETTGSDGGSYLTPDGPRPFILHEETLEVAGGESERLVVRETIWGPVVDEDHRGVSRAARWIAHDPDGVGFELYELETVTSVVEAIAVAQRSGIPPQNFMSADAGGSIGWTVTGRIPRRVGFDGRRPTSWATGERRWDGWVPPEDHPTRIDPAEGVLWTANARTVGGADLAVLGDGGYAFGARALQIRDDLEALEAPDEGDMLATQLDDRAHFMSRWRDYFLTWVEDEELRGLLEDDWSGRASPDSAAYRLVRSLRLALFEEIVGALTLPAAEADERFSVHRLRQWDGPLWRLVHERPTHLVPEGRPDWDAWMAEIVEGKLLEWRATGPLSARTWGELTAAEVRHPLSGAVPFASRWLDMPPDPLSGRQQPPQGAVGEQRGLGAARRLTRPRGGRTVPHAGRPERAPAVALLRRRTRRLGRGPSRRRCFRAPRSTR